MPRLREIPSAVHERLTRVYVPLLRLPPRVAWFHYRARRAALRAGDEWSLAAKTPPRELRKLLDLARGRGRVAEIGTGTAWTTVGLALADDGLEIVSYDPVARPHRDLYLGLAGDGARGRIELVEAPGDSGANGGPPVGMVFIDSSHERDETVATFRAWCPKVVPGGMVVFDDYHHPEFPGVREAVEDLGLEGEVFGRFFIWSKPEAGVPAEVGAAAASA